MGAAVVASGSRRGEHMTVTLELVDRLPRKCGGCTLCCKLLPVRELGKGAGVRCQHQRSGKGCAVYGPGMPPSCHLWSCAWLTGAVSGRRPDRAHYVVDTMPDFVELRDNTTGEKRVVPVVQVWCDPGWPDAHRDPDLRAYLETRGKDGVAALVRWNNREAIGLFPPSMSADGRWHEMPGGKLLPEHTFDEVANALGNST